MGKDSFVAYLSWGDAIAQLSDAEAGRLTKAIFEYVESGIAPTNLRSEAKMAFRFIIGQVQRDSAKYAERCKSAAERGRLGAQAHWGKRQKAGADTAEEKPIAKIAVAIPIADTDTDTVTDTDTDTDTVTESDTVSDTDTGNPPGVPAGGFADLLEKYPANRKGEIARARAEFDRTIKTPFQLALALNNLERWLCCPQWTKDGGQYIPSLFNWLSRGYWKNPPISDCCATGTLGNAELESIQRLLREDSEAEAPCAER